MSLTSTVDKKKGFKMSITERIEEVYKLVKDGILSADKAKVMVDLIRIEIDLQK